jgi:hypothetical protein
MQPYPATHPTGNETAAPWLTLDEAVTLCAGAAELPQTVNAMREALHRAAQGRGERRRAGSLGDREFPLAAFPGAVAAHIARQIAGVTLDRREAERRALWRAFQAKGERFQGEARRRLAAVAAFHELVDKGTPAPAALGEVVRTHGCSHVPLTQWVDRVAGVPRADWLPYLARSSNGAPGDEHFPELIEWFSAELRRPDRRSLQASYRRLEAVAVVRGWKVPALATLRRYITRAEAPA